MNPIMPPFSFLDGASWAEAALSSFRDTQGTLSFSGRKSFFSTCAFTFLSLLETHLFWTNARLFLNFPTHS